MAASMPSRGPVRQVGAVDKVRNILALVIGRNAQRHRYTAKGVVRAFAYQPFRRHDPANVVGDRGGATVGRVRQDDCEFLAAISGRRILALDGIVQNPADKLKNLIAELVTVCIVEVLEMVEIRHDQGQGEATFERVPRRSINFLVETFPVGDAGQAVGQGVAPGIVQRLAKRIDLVGGFGHPPVQLFRS